MSAHFVVAPEENRVNTSHCFHQGNRYRNSEENSVVESLTEDVQRNLRRPNAQETGYA